MSGIAPHPFWNFSLEVYAGEGVARACLDLQDRHGIDVNVLLFCCWLGASGRGRIERAALAALVGRIAAWQERVVVPLRQLRRLLASGEGLPMPGTEETTALRRRVADAEIDAEHIEQLLLAQDHAHPGNRDRPVKERLAAALANLGTYAELRGVKVERADRECVATILGACFPTLIAPEIAHALNLDR